MHALRRGPRSARVVRWVAVIAVLAASVGRFGQVAHAATVPGVPTAVNAVSDASRTATVSWTAPASNGGATITGYAVTPYAGYMQMPTRTFASTATTQVITNMTDGVTYRFKVAAINSVGTGAQSLPSNAMVPGSTAPPAPTTFVHPGVIVSKPDLDFVRAQIAAGRQPWKSAYSAMLTSYSESTERRPTKYKHASLSYVPAPVSVIQEGASASYIAAHPELGLENDGGTEHMDDAKAAYAHALIWAYTGNSANAAKAIQIMNAWSAKLTEIKFDQPRRLDNGDPVYINGKLQAGWGGSLFARAAEIVRHTGAGWSSTDVARFEAMLRNEYLPLTITSWSNTANWMMTLSEATMAIGVFINDRNAFNAGVAEWREKAPTTIYMATDGPLPIPPADYYDTASEIKALWYYPNPFLTGLQGETLRDISHMAFGLGALSNGAQTAKIQGVDLWGEEQARIVAGYERNAAWVNNYLDAVFLLGGDQPSSTWKPTGWPGSTFRTGGLAYKGGWELAYAYYADVLNIDMPQTKRLVARLRPSPPLFHNTWETLTNAKS